MRRPWRGLDAEVSSPRGRYRPRHAQLEPKEAVRPKKARSARNTRSLSRPLSRFCYWPPGSASASTHTRPSPAIALLFRRLPELASASATRGSSVGIPGSAKSKRSRRRRPARQAPERCAGIAAVQGSFRGPRYRRRLRRNGMSVIRWRSGRATTHGRCSPSWRAARGEPRRRAATIRLGARPGLATDRD